ncbi:MAG: 2OG-Fe(II) oxygenase [Lysobacteraceae bacterium]
MTGPTDPPRDHLPRDDAHRDDFIQVLPDALSRDACAEIVARIRASDALRPGQVGGGVYPELKLSRDLSITGQAGWQDVEQALNLAMLDGLIRYLRRWPQTLIAPLMLQRQLPDGSLRRLAAEDFPDMDAAQLGELARHCLRPGSVNLQWYRAGEGGYPYWHCELYPRDPGCETLHRHLLWTVYLNDEFEAGETEFLFQQRRIRPTTGTLLIAPAGFTHTHRGNRPQGGDKFIATSWILFQKAERLFPQG